MVKQAISDDLRMYIKLWKKLQNLISIKNINKTVSEFVGTYENIQHIIYIIDQIDEINDQMDEYWYVLTERDRKIFERWVNYYNKQDNKNNVK